MDVVTYSVGELGTLIRASLEHAFPSDLWVEGEIRSLRRPRSGHVYFDLVEPPELPGAAPVATIGVTLFQDVRAVVNRVLRRVGGMRIEDGMRVRIRGVVDYWAAQGRIQFRMTGIDPGYTLGILAAERERLLRRLHDEGLLDANRARALPLVPLRVALVTSHGSAAAADFLHELEISGHGFTVRLVDTVVQGVGADRRLAAAVAVAAGLDVDVVALVRGGGSRTDLACFDAEVLARAIASCRLPVLTGIGHEIDRSVADEVAHTAMKTPTACAAALVSQVDRFVAGLDERWASIRARTAARLDGGAAALERRGRHATTLGRTASVLPSGLLAERTGRLHRASTQALVRADGRLAERGHRAATAAERGIRVTAAATELQAAALRRCAPRPLGHEEQRLEGRAVRLDALDPARVLARGWTITRRADGRVVRAPADVAPGDELRTTTAGGTVVSTVTDAHDRDRPPDRTERGEDP